ncbi:flagellar motor switch protein FliG [Methylomarinovum caldicuralii]|uniref:Flagellar motor switch protein FliG n=1 Tax=Methylomarinovum caldicuralii TaxID=438856 RepID=A0AAU9CQ69_9GAMM|nr:flagellar motor switch protein FliG [Methylomarinovum caldicuralii]BCX81642.1 flagellar motor switch protein FliG [Methylomarinovum caldicuralii]
MAEIDELSGTDRAGLLLLAVGQKHAAAVFKHLEPKEVQLLGMSMASLENIRSEMVEVVVEQFLEQIRDQTALGLNSDAYIRQVMTEALGEDRASAVIDRILLSRNSRGIEQIKWMEPRAIAELVRLEHPQIIAIILSLLDAPLAAAVLGFLPEMMRPDIVMRIASLETVQPDALRELDAIMERQLSGKSMKSSNIGGIERAAEILNMTESAVEAQIIDQMEEKAPDLAQLIQDKMFVFDDLDKLDDRSMQTLLREVSTDTLLLALRGADEALKEKIFSNMSRRAAEMLRDDLEAAPPAKLSEVEAAQKEILQIARRLADAGEIALGGGGDELI